MEVVCRKEIEALEEWRREVARLEEAKIRALDEKVASIGESGHGSEAGNVEQLKTDAEISRDGGSSGGTDRLFVTGCATVIL